MGCGVSKNANDIIVEGKPSPVLPPQSVDDDVPLSPKGRAGPSSAPEKPLSPTNAAPPAAFQTPKRSSTSEDKENVRPDSSAPAASPPHKKIEPPALVEVERHTPNEVKASHKADVPPQLTESVPTPKAATTPPPAEAKGKAPEDPDSRAAHHEIHATVDSPPQSPTSEAGESCGKGGGEASGDVGKLPPLDGRSKLPPLGRAASLQKAEGKDPFAKAALPLHPLGVGVGGEDGLDDGEGVTVEMVHRGGGEVEVAITPKGRGRQNQDFASDEITVALTPRAGGGVDVLISPKGQAHPKSIFADDSTPKSPLSPARAGPSPGPLSPGVKLSPRGGPWGDDSELMVEMHEGEGGCVSVAISPKGARPRVESPDPDDVVPFGHHKLPYAAHVLEAGSSANSTPRSETESILNDIMSHVESDAGEGRAHEAKTKPTSRFATDLNTTSTDSGHDPTLPPPSPEDALRGTWKVAGEDITVVVEGDSASSLVARIGGAAEKQFRMEARCAWVMKGSSKSDELQFLVAQSEDGASFLGFYSDASKPQEGHLWVAEPGEGVEGEDAFVGKWSVRDVGEGLSIVMTLSHNEAGPEHRHGNFIIPGEEGSVAIMGTIAQSIVAFGRWSGESCEGRPSHDMMIFLDNEERAQLRLWIAKEDGNGALGDLHVAYDQSHTVANP